MDYDFGKEASDGTFVEGPLKGRTARMSLAELGDDIWQHLKDNSQVQGYLCRARELQRKAVVKEFVIMWCGAITRDEAGPFEELLRRDRVRGEVHLVPGEMLSREGAEDAGEDDDSNAAVADEDDDSNAAVEDEEDEYY